MLTPALIGTFTISEYSVTLWWTEVLYDYKWINCLLIHHRDHGVFLFKEVMSTAGDNLDFFFLRALCASVVN